MKNRFTPDRKITIFNDKIIVEGEIQNGMLMHIAEKELMNKLAELTTKNGGDILEIGFGMHLSADAIQSTPTINSHTIIEIHPKIYEKALEWAKNKPNTEILLGDWIDILPTINKQFDGVLYDAYMDLNLKKFLDYIKPNCKRGTIVTFFEYDGNLSVVNGVRVSLSKSAFETLPYKDITDWSTNAFELKYTIFDGEKFVRENKIKQII